MSSISIKYHEISQNHLKFDLRYGIMIKVDFLYRGEIMETINDNWIGIEEAAKYMGVTKETIRNWIKKTDIPAHKIGKLWKFQKSELEKWIKSGKSALEWFEIVYM